MCMRFGSKRSVCKENARFENSGATRKSLFFCTTGLYAKYFEVESTNKTEELNFKKQFDIALLSCLHYYKEIRNCEEKSIYAPDVYSPAY